tara:strand:+ start:1515 stop:1898 length:384 start_codon:yes stop_codon:yes gene_type:complete
MGGYKGKKKVNKGSGTGLRAKYYGTQLHYIAGYPKSDSRQEENHRPIRSTPPAKITAIGQKIRAIKGELDNANAKRNAQKRRIEYICDAMNPDTAQSVYFESDQGYLSVPDRMKSNMIRRHKALTGK